MARLFQISISTGGVPKLPITEAFVSKTKVGDDLHNHPEHGGLLRAVCVFSLERILALQAEGNTIFPGAVVENWTIAGLDCDDLHLGSQLKIGDEVLLEIDTFAPPCGKLRRFLKDFNHISEERHPGWVRPYCKVLQTGTVRIASSTAASLMPMGINCSSTIWSRSRLKSIMRLRPFLVTGREYAPSNGGR
jgi:MOSC domain-containing protein YiiM